MPKLIAMMRVKNEVPIVKDCLGKLSELVDEVVIVDNGSTDGTLEAYKEFPKIVTIIHTEGFHEGRDKILAHEAAKKRNPDWIIWIDADEIFEKHLTRVQMEKYMNYTYNQIHFRMFNFWLDKERFRVDGHFFIYTLNPQRSMWRNIEGTYFSDKRIHNGAIKGLTGKSYISPYRIKHFGNKDLKEIQKKYELCTAIGLDEKRDLSHYNHIRPDVEGVKLIKFQEFQNYKLNLAYIVIYKYICNFLRLTEQAKNKFSDSLSRLAV